MVYNGSLVIAVTGGIGCGQSTVCKFLEKKGVKVINADMVAKREIDRNEEVQKELRRIFGSRIFYRNKKLNRKLLASIAFADEAKTVRLNRIVHPYMVSKIVTIIEEERERKHFRIIAVDAALIYELNLEHMFNAVVVVSSPMRYRIDRIKKRDNLSQKEIMDRMNKQIPIEDKIKWGDFVITNNRDLEALERSTIKVYKDLVLLLKNKKRSATA